jgi:hypothetical protein
MKGGDPLRIDAAGRFALASQSEIRGQGAGVLNARAGSIGFDPGSSVINSAITLTSAGEMTIGKLTSYDATQPIVLRSAGLTSLGTITGPAITIVNTGGATTLKAASGGALSLDSAGDITTEALELQRAVLFSRQGSVNLNGFSQVRGLGANSILDVKAIRAITVGREVATDGGVRFTAATIATAAGAFIRDTGGLSALQQLRGDTINVRFDTGSGSIPLRLDVSGASNKSALSATLDFIGSRPIIFTRLSAYTASLNVLGANPSLTISSLTMRDWLALKMGGGSMLLKGEASTGPATDRTVATGALTAASLVATPTSAAPSVQLNGKAL